jgi:hypothetical protein
MESGAVGDKLITAAHTFQAMLSDGFHRRTTAPYSVFIKPALIISITLPEHLIAAAFIDLMR